MTISPFSGNSRIRIYRRPSLATCHSCNGATIGKFGEQCRVCSGRGFTEHGKVADDGLNRNQRFDRYRRNMPR